MLSFTRVAATHRKCPSGGRSCRIMHTNTKSEVKVKSSSVEMTSCRMCVEIRCCTNTMHRRPSVQNLVSCCNVATANTSFRFTIRMKFLFSASHIADSRATTLLCNTLHIPKYLIASSRDDCLEFTTKRTASYKCSRTKYSSVCFRIPEAFPPLSHRMLSCVSVPFANLLFNVVSTAATLSFSFSISC